MSYNPGHMVHYIQAQKAAADGDTMVRGRITTIEPGRITVGLEDDTERAYWCHDLVRAAALLEECGPDVRVQERWALLWFGTRPISIRRIGSTSKGCA